MLTPPLPGSNADVVRKRAVVLALAGVALLSLFVQWSDIQIGGTMVAGPFPPLGAMLLWCLLLMVDGLLRRWPQGRAGALLNRSERLVILAVWLVGNMVAGRGLLHPLLTSLAGPLYYAKTPTISGMIASGVPGWLAITDSAAVKGFFEGRPAGVPWEVWWHPLLTWGLFFIPFILANVCLCALFERIWVRHERLAFPLVALPIEIAEYETGRRFWKDFRIPFLLGFAFPLLLHGFGVLHAYYPAVPAVSLTNDWSANNAVYPLSVLNPLYINFYPILVGLTFLAPADVTLGVWFFILLNKGQMYLTAIFGWNEGQIASPTRSAPPFVEEQSAGAYLALGGLMIWHARFHLRGIWEAMWSGATENKDNMGDYSVYRPLGWGFVLGAAGVLLWCLLVGFPLWYGGLFFGFYGLVALVLSRLMAEGGVAWILAPILPDKLLIALFGSTSVSATVLTRTIFFMQHLRDTRQMLAPAVFQTGKLRDVAGFPVRRFYGLLLAGIAVSLAVGTLAALPILYRHGASALVPSNDGMTMCAVVIPRSALQQAEGRMQTPVVPSPAAGVAAIAGGIMAYGLSLLRLRYAWWPLHPLGYALTGTLQLGYANKMLLSVFLGWLFKTLVQRFGGMAGFRLLRAVAFGLIVGDLLMGGIVKGLDALLGPSEYALF